MLKFYCGFEINDHTGSALTDREMSDKHYESITSLQRAVFKNYKNDALDFVMGNVASVDTRESLKKCFKKLRLEYYKLSLLSRYYNTLQGTTPKNT